MRGEMTTKKEEGKTQAERPDEENTKRRENTSPSCNTPVFPPGACLSVKPNLLSTLRRRLQRAREGG